MNNYYNGQNNQQNNDNNSYGAYSYTPVAPKEKKGHSTGVVILSVVLAAIIGASAGITGILSYIKIGGTTSSETPSSDTGTTKNISISVDENAESIAEAVSEKAGNSVVGIRTTTSVMSFFGGSQPATGSGSGVVYSKDGYIITNYHVIEDVVESANSSKIEVFIGDAKSKSYDATVVGYSISSDLAVIKIDADNLSPVEFADSSKLKVGQPAVIIGAPGGLEFMGSVTYGVISGLNRVVSSNSSVALIQTDAAINPGNSGGALLDSTGKLIGINSSKIVAQEYESMGFAIPSNKVSEVVKNIISKENSPEPYIGITISERYTAQILKYYGYPAGAVVLSVYEGSPADAAGIKRGDIITEFNGKEITEYNLFDDYLKECDPGQIVTMKVYRNGNTYDVNVTIAADTSSK
ncbi:MAG: trypsin-like peptidase domain-containing protein [Clostridia bacterium]|nr:trypsin-like peptidase domain-containing protein [Clostridia bacterium]